MSLVLPEKKTSVGLDLAKLLRPEQVRWDWATLKAYSVDASIYKITPQVVVLPETEADIDVVVEYAERVGVPLTPRAAGTNLTGSALGSGIIVDSSRMNQILQVNLVSLQSFSNVLAVGFRNILKKELPHQC